MISAFKSKLLITLATAIAATNVSLGTSWGSNFGRNIKESQIPPDGECQDLPRRPLPPICLLARQSSPSTAPSLANSLAISLVDPISSKYLISLPINFVRSVSFIRSTDKVSGLN